MMRRWTVRAYPSVIDRLEVERGPRIKRTKTLERSAPIKPEGARKKRNKNKEKAFKASIRKRDRHTCQNCGFEGQGLHVHHLFTVGAHPELQFASWNCITLCPSCHTDGPDNAHSRMTEFRRMIALSFNRFRVKYDVEGDCPRLEAA